MPSPAGIFVGLPIESLYRIQAACVEGAVNGRVSSESAGGKTEGRQFDLPISQALIEVNYAIQKATGKLPPNKIVNRLVPREYGVYNGF